MWFFKRKKKQLDKAGFSSGCPYCLSLHTSLITNSTSEQPDYVKTWRGQRYVTCRCLDCGKEFYADEPAERLSIDVAMDDEIVADPEQLRAAEEELRREVEDSDDRLCG
jgi:hypothetical protein